MLQDRPAGSRSSLNLEQKKVGNAKYWIARGTHPYRAPDGSLQTSTRREFSLGNCEKVTRRDALKLCAELNQSFEDQAKATRKTLSFARAAQNYMLVKKHVPQYVERLLGHFAETACHLIDNNAMVEAARALFPENAKPGYLNRHLYTPVISILRLASMDGYCPKPDFLRPVGHSIPPRVKAPDDDNWYRLVAEYLPENTRAMMVALTIHGARAGELISRTPEDLRPVNGRFKLYLGRTKNGDVEELDLEPGVVDLIMAIKPEQQQTRKGARLFGYTTVEGFNKKIKEACELAGVSYFSSHKLGRHRFALRMLDDGRSSQAAQNAGRWRDPRVFATRYGFREHSELTSLVHDTGSHVSRSLIDDSGLTGEKEGKDVGSPSPLARKNP